MRSLTFPNVDKLLDTVLGFRPTEAEMDLISKAEGITGRKRSDLLRACFHSSIRAVVETLDAERAHAKADFERTLTALADGPASIKPPPGTKPASYLSSKRGKKVA